MGAGPQDSTSRRVLWPWLITSVVLVYLVQGVPALIAFAVEMAARGDESWLARHGLFDAVPLWTSPEWVLALAVYAISLAVLDFALRRQAKVPIFWTCAVATVAYLLAAALFLTVGPYFTVQALVENAQWIAALGLGVWGNAWATFLIPLFVAATPRNRHYFYGRLGSAEKTSDL
jgi:hypothetical protein